MTWLVFPFCGKRSVVSILLLGYRGGCKDLTLLSSFRPTVSVSANSVFEVGVEEACVFLFQCLLGSKTHSKHRCDSIIIKSTKFEVIHHYFASSLVHHFSVPVQQYLQRISSVVVDEITHGRLIVNICQFGRDAKTRTCTPLVNSCLGLRSLFKFL